MVSWTELLHDKMRVFGDGPSCIVHAMTIDEGDLNKKFDMNIGSEDGPPFVVFTHNFVYFSMSMRGANGVGAIPRHPHIVPPYMVEI
jgi:hypothetical protein